MNLVFFLNHLNHHQVALTDVFYKELGNDFVCILTVKSDFRELKGGSDYSSRPYCINATESDKNYAIAIDCARNADVCLFGAESIDYAIVRAKSQNTGLSFEVGERWFKKGILNVFSPRFLKWLYNYFRYFKNNNFYRLCASGFAAQDVNFFRAYRGRCFKWGYFIESNLECENHLSETACDKTPFNLMWCGRFIKWKHPEIPIILSSQLKAKGYKFCLDMYGDGGELKRVKDLVLRLGVDDVVNFCGVQSNEHIRSEMKLHDLFLLTSDQNEGWGVVLNEAMLAGCTVVASSKVGAVPFLLEDGVNGSIFESGDITSLVEKVTLLLDNPMLRHIMSINAKHTISSVWSPTSAVKNLLQLIKALELKKVELVPHVGPCSIVK